MNMNKSMPIQIITDIYDVSYNEIYAVMISIAKKLKVKVEIAPVASVYELSILHGAFITRLLAESYLIPTVFFTNVSPLQKKPNLVIGETNTGHIFIGPNNGVFEWLAKDHGLKCLNEVVANKNFVVDGKLIYLPTTKPPKDYDHLIKNHLTDNKVIFDSKTLIGPLAVAIASGQKLKTFCQVRENNFLVGFKIEKGTVVHIDNFGIIKIKGSLSFPSGTKIKVLINGKKRITAIYSTGRMMSHTAGSYILYPSTSFQGLTDLARVRCIGSYSAAKTLNINIGDIVNFKVG
jgi:S-adenosylmethionine hydrolase